MKISKMFTVLAAVALLAGLASCSSDDNPVVPVTPASSGPSVKIYGANEIASVTTFGNGAQECYKSTSLFAIPSGFGKNTVKISWTFADTASAGYGDLANANNWNATFTATSDTVAADQTAKIKVVVSSADDKVKAEATYSVKILKDSTKPVLKFLDWRPNILASYTESGAGASTTYSPRNATGVIDPVKPGESCYMPPVEDPIYNGYSAKTQAQIKTGWVYKTSSTDVAKITVGGVAQDAATYTDDDGSHSVSSLCVNKTDKESVTLTVTGTYHFGAANDPSFIRTVTRTVAKGKKVPVKIFYGTSADTPKYGTDAVTKKDDPDTYGVYAEITDLYAGVDYVTKAVTVTGKHANGLTTTGDASISPDTVSATDAGVLTLRVDYATATAGTTKSYKAVFADNN